MVARLTANHVNFDIHIAGMERALGGAAKEMEDVKLLMRQLEGGRQDALADVRK